MRWGAFRVAGIAVLLASCQREGGNTAPPRIEAPAAFPDRNSTIEVPATVLLSDLEAGLNARTPTTLWTIDKKQQRCVPPKKLKVFGRRVKVTPVIRCDIVGRVTRGSIRLGGSGSTLTITMPVSATIAAERVGGIIKRETATGKAIVRARATLSVDRAWRPTARVRIAYDWTVPPGIDFLGQRIRFVDQADARLAKVIAGLERDLPKELAKVDLRAQLEKVWRHGFTSVMLNRERPPVWLRITPRALGFGGYRITGKTVELNLSAEALTQTFVGDRPADPTPTPLPPPVRGVGAGGLHFFLPVLADYAQLEPVAERALIKLAAKGIILPGIGPVDAKFGKVTIYATQGGRIAIGIKASVKGRERSIGGAKGEVWLSAIPYNEPNSQRVHVRDLKIAGQTDNRAVNILFALFEDGPVRDELRAALTEDFGKDYARILAAARNAIAQRREGDLILSANITDVRNGQIEATGAGLFLPVAADGTARIAYRPH